MNLCPLSFQEERGCPRGMSALLTFSSLQNNRLYGRPMGEPPFYNIVYIAIFSSRIVSYIHIFTVDPYRFHRHVTPKAVNYFQNAKPPHIGRGLFPDIAYRELCSPYIAAQPAMQKIFFYFLSQENSRPAPLQRKPPPFRPNTTGFPQTRHDASTPLTGNREYNLQKMEPKCGEDV